MVEERIIKMRNGRDIPQVTLQRYNLLRSKFPGKLIFSFEGYDDVTFYDVMFRKTTPVDYVPFVCKGKDKVLELRLLLSRNTAEDSNNVRYFVDKDFDDLKGHNPGADIYCTPGYSFENLLVNRSILEALLRGEYRCSDENSETDVENILNLFESRCSEFFECISDANLLIFYARKNKLKINSINEDIKKYVSISPDCVKAEADFDALCKLIGYSEVLDRNDVAAFEAEFSGLNPYNDWRGKFIYYFFKKFLSDIKEDRGAEKPKYFKSRANMSFSPGADMTRTLAAIASVPACFNEFAKSTI